MKALFGATQHRWKVHRRAGWRFGQGIPETGAIHQGGRGRTGVLCHEVLALREAPGRSGGSAADALPSYQSMAGSVLTLKQKKINCSEEPIRGQTLCRAGTVMLRLLGSSHGSGVITSGKACSDTWQSSLHSKLWEAHQAVPDALWVSTHSPACKHRECMSVRLRSNGNCATTLFPATGVKGIWKDTGQNCVLASGPLPSKRLFRTPCVHLPSNITMLRCSNDRRIPSHSF